MNCNWVVTGGSSTVHIYTQTIHRTKQNKQYIEQHNNLGECGPCPVLARFTLAFALQLKKKHGKTLVRDVSNIQGVHPQEDLYAQFYGISSICRCSLSSTEVWSSCQLLCRVAAHSKWILYSRSLSFCFFIYIYIYI